MCLASSTGSPPLASPPPQARTVPPCTACSRPEPSCPGPFGTCLPGKPHTGSPPKPLSTPGTFPGRTVRKGSRQTLSGTVQGCTQDSRQRFACPRPTDTFPADKACRHFDWQGLSLSDTCLVHIMHSCLRWSCRILFGTFLRCKLSKPRASLTRAPFGIFLESTTRTCSRPALTGTSHPCTCCNSTCRSFQSQSGTYPNRTWHTPPLYPFLIRSDTSLVGRECNFLRLPLPYLSGMTLGYTVHNLPPSPIPSDTSQPSIPGNCSIPAQSGTPLHCNTCRREARLSYPSATGTCRCRKAGTRSRSPSRIQSGTCLSRTQCSCLLRPTPAP